MCVCVCVSVVMAFEDHQSVCGMVDDDQPCGLLVYGMVVEEEC